MCQIRDLKKTVKKKLIDIGKTQRWLIERVKEETGMYCDESLLKKIYEGKVHSVKIESAICEILGLK